MYLNNKHFNLSDEIYYPAIFAKVYILQFIKFKYCYYIEFTWRIRFTEKASLLNTGSCLELLNRMKPKYKEDFI